MVEPLELESKVTARGTFSLTMDGVVALCTLAAIVPLASLLYMVIVKGLATFRFDMLWTLPPGPADTGGGFGNAIVGTLALVAIASLVAVPLGILTSIFLTEYASGTKAARTVRFACKILSGIPSILAGVFIYAAVVLTFESFSVIAGGLALAVLMLPIIVLSAEEALLRVPKSIRDASTGLGATTSQTILRVTLPACTPSLITGVMLAVARAAGETAPVMFTALFSDYWLERLDQPTASLSMLIYNFSSMPFENMIDVAWSASLVLILLVLATNIISHIITKAK